MRKGHVERLIGFARRNFLVPVPEVSSLAALNQQLLQANRDRLRPILMTTVAFVAGMLPLLIATGPGAEERRSIAVLAVGGQTLSLVPTLLAVPIIYTFFDDLSALWHRLFDSKPVESSEAVPGHQPA